VQFDGFRGKGETTKFAALLLLAYLSGGCGIAIGDRLSDGKRGHRRSKGSEAWKSCSLQTVIVVASRCAGLPSPIRSAYRRQPASRICSFDGERRFDFVYATPRHHAVDGVDSIILLIPKDWRPINTAACERALRASGAALLRRPEWAAYPHRAVVRLGWRIGSAAPKVAKKEVDKARQSGTSRRLSRCIRIFNAYASHCRIDSDTTSEDVIPMRALA
jgi:hypothetical protein